MTKIQTSYLGKNKPLAEGLKEAMAKAEAVDISVSFIMESGVRLLEPELRSLAERKVPIRILVGEYMGITQPQALYLLREICGAVLDMRFYSDLEEEHFHPKAYFFHYGGMKSEFFLGSSNMSRSALTTGIEWNCRLNNTENKDEFDDFYDEFLFLFEYNARPIDDRCLRDYARNWRAPKVFGRNRAAASEEVFTDNGRIQPRGAQIEALCELKRTRNEGLDKALVVAATGVGKTYLAAFDCVIAERILFVAHREEILKQASETFEKIYPNKKLGWFNSEKKDTEADILFASVQTLGKDVYLNQDVFSPTYFDYIVVDEFHHAAAVGYGRILQYFKPRFLLGLTATPDRLDNKDIYRLCDYNLVYDIDLFAAINRDFLVPFHYYGIYDETNYDEIEFHNGRYDEKQLEKALMLHKRAEIVYANYRKFNSARAIGFCATQAHAIQMAEYFDSKGITSRAVVSGRGGTPRDRAIEELESGRVRVLFTVDMFNEGVDIPSLDMVLFLRPTESPTVFLQQLGRGLRKCGGKKYLNVLDFIGNYKKAFLIPSLLRGRSQTEKAEIEARGERILSVDVYADMEEWLPEGCRADFDFRLIDLMERQRKQSCKLEDQLREEYFRVRAYLDHRPSRTEFYTYMDDGVKAFFKKRGTAAFHPFRRKGGYLAFLESLGDLSTEELELKNTFAADFLHLLETTDMSKLYKLPLLLAFYDGAGGSIRLEIGDKQIADSFRSFYENPSNGWDMKRHKSTEGYLTWTDEEYIRLAKKNPVHFLMKTSARYFTLENERFGLSKELEPYCEQPRFAEHFLDCLEQRRVEFYKNRFDKIVGEEKGDGESPK